MRLRCNLLASLCLVFCINTSIAGEFKRASNIDLELWRALFVDFAKQHSLSEAQVMELLGFVIVRYDNLSKVTGRIVFDGKYKFYMNKGGVIALGRGVYYFVDRKRNTLSIAQNREWEGLDSSQPEAVFTDGEHVSHTADGIDLSKAMIVIFSSSEVRILDLMEHSGWTIPRKRVVGGNGGKPAAH